MDKRDEPGVTDTGDKRKQHPADRAVPRHAEQFAQPGRSGQHRQVAGRVIGKIAFAVKLAGPSVKSLSPQAIKQFMS